jgi:hypothetical protein
MGAYSIAGSPTWVSGGKAYVPSLSSVLIAVPQSMGFRETRQPSAPPARARMASPESSPSGLGSVWLWVLTAAALAVVLIQRRLMRN